MSPEFEELAAIQAGYAYRPIIARRDKTETEARSVMGEFVSGNYFRTFGLQPRAGRFFTDADDKTGAPMTAMISYDAWQRDYAGDPSVVGSTFWVNTRPVTIVGIAPQGFFGDRMSSTPPDFYLPIYSMPLLANAPYVNEPASRWLYMIGRVKPGVALDPLQQKLSALFRQSIASEKDFATAQGKDQLARAPHHAHPRRRRHPGNAGAVLFSSSPVDVDFRPGPSDRLRQHREPPSRPRNEPARGDVHPHRTRSNAFAASSASSSPKASCWPRSAGSPDSSLPMPERACCSRSPFPAHRKFPSIPVHLSLSSALPSACRSITGVLFGVAPAWITAQSNPADALRTGTRTTTGGASLLQRSLVVFQAALSLVLLIGAGLFSQSLSKLQNTDMKLQSKNRYIVHINPQAAGYSQTQLEALYRTIEQRFHAIPGVVKTGSRYLHAHGRQQLE